MVVRQPLTADDVISAGNVVTAALAPACERDWSVAAGDLEWSCARTADHLGRCLIAYAGQLAVQPADRYVRFRASIDDEAPPADRLAFIQGGAAILAAMVRTCAPSVRAFHPYGVSDPEGFAGMGCVEILLHGDDLSRGLAVPFDPPAPLCARVLARMFPEVEGVTEDGETDPWTLLRHATGRAQLPGRPPVTSWSWHGAPLPEPPAR